MSFDEENQSPAPVEKDEEKGKTFFGLEVGDSMVYGIVVILAVIFIVQISKVIALL